MKENPTIRGHRINSAPSYPERPYIYAGDEPFTPKPKKEGESDDRRSS